MRLTRWRKAGRWVAGTLAVATVAWLAARDTSPVGHFTSADGRDQFITAYDRAMAELPRPDATLDLRTSFGVVRIYRFDGSAPDAPPLLLLPGRASASPMWSDNLPSLLRLRTVYTVDLLGEPGASVQDRPIESDADHARWLHEALAGLPDASVVLVGVSIGGWTAGGAPVEDVPVADMIESGLRNYVLKLPAPTRITAEQLSGLDVPVLVIIAGESVMHDPAKAARTASERLPNATVLTYDGASHAVNGEQPERIADDVAAFLDGR